MRKVFKVKMTDKNGFKIDGRFLQAIQDRFINHPDYGKKLREACVDLTEKNKNIKDIPLFNKQEDLNNCMALLASCVIAEFLTTFEVKKKINNQPKE